MTNIIQLAGSTLVIAPGHRTAFAISHSDRSVVDVFELQPKAKSAEALLATVAEHVA